MNYIGVKDKHGQEIKVGDFIQDGHGMIGKVVKNMHPWGFERLQYNGLSIVHNAGKDWYEIMNREKIIRLLRVTGEKRYPDDPWLKELVNQAAEMLEENGDEGVDQQ